MAGEDEITVIHYRLANPPEEIQRELEILFDEYYAQFDEDDEVPENGFQQYKLEHGSVGLKAYMKMIEKTLEDAKRRGARV